MDSDFNTLNFEFKLFVLFVEHIILHEQLCRHKHFYFDSFIMTKNNNVSLTVTV